MEFLTICYPPPTPASGGDALIVAAVAGTSHVLKTLQLSILLLFTALTGHSQTDSAAWLKKIEARYEGNYHYTFTMQADEALLEKQEDKTAQKGYVAGVDDCLMFRMAGTEIIYAAPHLVTIDHEQKLIILTAHGSRPEMIPMLRTNYHFLKATGNTSTWQLKQNPRMWLEYELVSDERFISRIISSVPGQGGRIVTTFTAAAMAPVSEQCSAIIQSIKDPSLFKKYFPGYKIERGL